MGNKQVDREPDANLAAGLGACSAAATYIVINILTSVWLGLQLGRHPWWQLLAVASVAHVFFMLWLCLIAVMVVVPSIAVLRLCKIDRFWAVLPLFLLISQLPDLIAALPPAEGSSFSAYYRGCQAIIDNVVTQCGERLARERQVSNLMVGAVASIAFYATYRVLLRPAPTTG